MKKIFLLPTILLISFADAFASIEVAEQYDIDYAGAENSMYNMRFGSEEYIQNEYFIINDNFNNLHKKFKNDDYVIFDFGCGNGRLVALFEKIAMNNRKLNITIISYDISKVAIEEFSKKLDNRKYERNNSDPEEKSNIKKKYQSWQKNNLKFILTNNWIDSLLYKNSVDMIVSMYCVFGHIEKKEKRLIEFQKLNNLIKHNGSFIVNVCTKRSLPREVEAYDLIRNQRALICKSKNNHLCNDFNKILKNAQEDGDFYYTKTNNKILTHNFGHVYTRKELIHDMQNSGFVRIKTGVMSIDHPYILTGNKIKNWSDYLLSKIISFNSNIWLFNRYDTIAKNIYGIGYSDNNSKIISDK